jgi:hypothetical protein
VPDVLADVVTVDQRVAVAVLDAVDDAVEYAQGTTSPMIVFSTS